MDQRTLAITSMIPHTEVNDTDKTLIQTFIQTKGVKRQSSSLRIILDHRVSTVATTESQKKIVKLVRARTLHEHLKVLWQRSRTHTEFKGAKLLRSIGIGAPEVYEMGISYPLPGNYPYIGYYVMESLETTGFFPLRDVLKACGSGDTLALAQNVISALKLLERNQVLYSELSLDNILCHKQSLEIRFIDTGAKRIRIKSRHFSRHIKSIESFIAGIQRAKFQSTEFRDAIEEFMICRLNSRKHFVKRTLFTSLIPLLLMYYLTSISEVI